MLEPPKKKSKMSSEDDGSQRRFHELLKSMQESRRNLRPILGDAFVAQCKKQNFYVAKIKEKKMTSTVIAKLATVFPSNDFGHLKRVWNSEALLSPCSISEIDLRTILDKEGLSSLLSDDISICQVASEAPKLRWQYELAQTSWPCNFHPNKYWEKLCGGAFFDDAEIRKHRRYMRLAYAVGESNSSELSLEDTRGVVIVDPKIDSVVSIGWDGREANPCQHAVMVAVDNVAKSQGGGAWNDGNSDTRLVELRGVPQDMINSLLEQIPGVRFGARPYRPKNESNDEDPGPYICTGYEVYCTKEPCLMCAMALVHSRVSRVFFATKNSLSGGLVSKCKLHDVKDLNHHYEVFTGFFESEEEAGESQS